MEAILSKLEIIAFNEKDKWNSIVKSFDTHDVYYLNEYVSAFRYTNDGNCVSERSSEDNEKNIDH